MPVHAIIITILLEGGGQTLLSTSNSFLSGHCSLLVIIKIKSLRLKIHQEVNCLLLIINESTKGQSLGAIVPSKPQLLMLDHVEANKTSKGSGT